MDDYLFAMFLAEDIMKCALKKHGMIWQSKNDIRSVYKGKLPDRLVVLCLEKAIETFIKKNEKYLEDIMYDYINNNSPTVKDFCLYTIEFGSEIFKDGFDPVNFIKYSATVAEMASLLHVFGDDCQDIPEHASGVIGTVLVSQIMTGQFSEFEGEEGLKKACYKLLKQSRNVETTEEYEDTRL